jgi:hypothetical protein
MEQQPHSDSCIRCAPCLLASGVRTDGPTWSPNRSLPDVFSSNCTFTRLFKLIIEMFVSHLRDGQFI